MPLYITTLFGKQMPQGTVALVEAETKERAVELLAIECAKFGIDPVPAEYVCSAQISLDSAVFFSQSKGY